MFFSTGIWDTLFGKKVTIEIPDSYGNIVKRKCTEKWITQVEKENTPEVKENLLVKVHILDAVKGYRVGYWVLNQDIPESDASSNTDPETKALYAIYYWEDDEPRLELLKRVHWERVYNKVPLLKNKAIP